MSRRRFLKTTALTGATLIAAPASFRAGAQRPARFSEDGPYIVRMGGYGPPDTSFSVALKHVGDRLESGFGERIDIRYVYNIMDVNYGPGDLTWLADSGVLTLVYTTLSSGIPALDVATLPFVFPDNAAARAAFDGELGQAATERIEALLNVRVLGYFENGFRHLSNSVRPVSAPGDMQGLRIRVLDAMVRPFELLGAEPEVTSLDEVMARFEAGTLDGQENPYSNVVVYGMHEWQRFYTTTAHSYMSRPILVHRPTFESWPERLQQELRAAMREAVQLQRELREQEEQEARAIIRAEGGEIIELTPAQREAFAAAVAPVYQEARRQYDSELLSLVGV